ncbi:MAG: CotH kinase family protein [Paludibacteraceae bacterium]|nr:CotH kinase family protein [Paludibacteraceae bacterium]
MKKIKLLLAIVFLCTTPSFASVYINEVVASNTTYEVGGEYPDWIELYNDDSANADIGGWYMSDKKSKLKYQLPEGTVIAPKSYLLIYADDKGEGLHLNFKISKDGEKIFIFDSNGEMVNNVETPSLGDDVSYGRLTDGNNTMVRFTPPSPATANDPSKVLTSTPVISQKSGFYNEPVTVEITTDDDLAEIRYTLDGSVPNGTSNLYTEPLTFETTTVLRAISYITGAPVGTPASETYLINERKPELPVALLVTDPKNLFDDEIGIYVTGTNGIPGNCSDIPRNWNQDWERPANFCYLGESDTSQLNIDLGIKIAGGCSRQYTKKTLNLKTNSKYADGKLNYRFFKDRENDTFKAVKLRNTGVFSNGDYVHDILSAELAKGMDIDYQAFQPIVVFVNGEYWGIFNLREKLDEHYIQENYGIDKDEVNMMENHYHTESGSIQSYVDLQEEFLTDKLSLENESDYLYVTSHIDMSNFIDYSILQTFISNSDWPYNNVRCWSEKGIEKWRWILYDTDLSYGLYGDQIPASSPYAFDSQLLAFEPESKYPEWSNRLFRRLITNDSFLNEFTQRYALYLSTALDYNNTSESVDSLSNLIRNEMPYEFDKWKNNTIAGWEESLSSLKTFLFDRPQYMYQFLQERFGVEGTFNTKISVEGGEANIGLYGINLATPFEGLLFGKRPIQLEPSFDHELYEIDHWQITTEEGKVVNIFEDTLNYTLTSNSDIRLILKEPTPVGTNDNSFNSNITVWPNPASDIITISGGTDDVSYIISNIAGNKLLKGTGRSVDVSNLSQGIYIISVSENNNTTTNRIIVER